MPTTNTVSARLVDTLSRFKNEYENALRVGNSGNLIRSGRLIGYLHSFVESELLNAGFPGGWILRDSTLYGFPKKKSQDILVVPTDAQNTGPILSINLRSQLSSIEKNFDTMYERVYAEALNLHNRFPFLTLGYIYLIPLIGYDTSVNDVIRNDEYNIAKFLTSFSAINSRQSENDDEWKYESLCLLLVDFSENPPQSIIKVNDITRLEKNVIPMVDEEILSIDIFFNTILNTTMKRNFEYFLKTGISLNMG